MSATGMSSAPSDVMGLLTKTTAQVTVGTADITAAATFNAGVIRRVVPQVSGTVFIQRSGDSAAVSYVATAGQPIDGEITLIGGSTNYPSASPIVLNLEM